MTVMSMLEEGFWVLRKVYNDRETGRVQASTIPQLIIIISGCLLMILSISSILNGTTVDPNASFCTIS